MAQQPVGNLGVRVKYYNKTLELTKSESVMKSLGMNMKAIYYPNIHMGRALRESMDIGLTRIEITYTATTMLGMEELLDELFPDQAAVNLTSAYLAL